MTINTVEQLMIMLANLDILDRNCDDSYRICPGKDKLPIEIECHPEITLDCDVDHKSGDVIISVGGSIDDNYYTISDVEYQEESDGFGEMLIISAQEKDI